MKVSSPARFVGVVQCLALGATNKNHREARLDRFHKKQTPVGLG